jgi:hypothetical protein
MASMEDLLMGLQEELERRKRGYGARGASGYEGIGGAQAQPGMMLPYLTGARQVYDYSGPGRQQAPGLDPGGPSGRHFQRQGIDFPGFENQNPLGGPNVAPGAENMQALQQPGLPPGIQMQQQQGMGTPPGLAMSGGGGRPPQSQGWRNYAPGYAGAASVFGQQWDTGGPGGSARSISGPTGPAPGPIQAGGGGPARNAGPGGAGANAGVDVRNPVAGRSGPVGGAGGGPGSGVVGQGGGGRGGGGGGTVSGQPGGGPGDAGGRPGGPSQQQIENKKSDGGGGGSGGGGNGPNSLYQHPNQVSGKPGGPKNKNIANKKSGGGNPGPNGPPNGGNNNTAAELQQPPKPPPKPVGKVKPKPRPTSNQQR